MSGSAPQSICVLRLSAIGDVCHAVAVVQAIQRHNPEAHITWVVGKVEYQLLNGMPGIEFVVFDKKQGLSAFWLLRQALKGKQFDCLLHMQVSLRASLASLAIPATRRIGVHKSRAKEGQWLFTNEQIGLPVGEHVLDGFMAFAEHLGVESPDVLWDMPISSDERNWVEQHIDGDKPLFVMAPSASKAERNWTVKGYVYAAEYAANRGAQVVICGGPSPAEQSLAALIEQTCRCDVRNLVGQTSLKQLLALIERANVVLAPDTGPAHMATTVNTPVIGLYAHSNPARTGPYCDQHNVVSVYEQVIEEQKGQAVSELNWGTRAKGENLMERIAIDDVLQKMATYL